MEFYILLPANIFYSSIKSNIFEVEKTGLFQLNILIISIYPHLFVHIDG